MAAIAQTMPRSLEVQEPVRDDRLSFDGLTEPVVLRTHIILTDEELIAFSRANKMFQIERNAEGDLEIMSPSGFTGSFRELLAGRMLANWADDNGGVTVGATAGFKLGAIEVRCPDAAWVSNEKVNRLSLSEAQGFAPFCPEFLIEVRSRRDTRVRLEQKMQMWIDSGAQLAWMIDPYAAEVLIYRVGVSPELLKRPDWVEADAVVPGFRLQTSRMWEE